MQYPVNFIYISQLYSAAHRGVDLGWSSKYGGKNQPIYAVEDGIVIYSKYQTSGGYVLHIRHDNGYVSEYGHLKKDSERVKVGSKVKRGDIIALMGGTGKVTGNHLHFGLYKGRVIDYGDKSKFVDPILYLYATKNQVIASSTEKKYNILKETNKYKKGIYKCLYNMNIRSGPDIHASRVKVSECTKEMRAALTSDDLNAYAVIKKDTNITGLDVIEDGNYYWIKNYSGYICIDDNYCQYLEYVGK